MENLDEIIGLSYEDACKVLRGFGYNKINVITNSKQSCYCNLKLVCAVRVLDDGITLVLGEFLGLGNDGKK